MSASTTDVSRWLVVYPVYLNAKKKVSEGRRLAKEKAVDQPTLQEIISVGKALGLEVVAEPTKAFPRDFTQVGRVRFHLKDDSKTPLKETIKSKQQLLEALAVGISKIPNRSSSSSASNATAASASQIKKKKGKK